MRTPATMILGMVLAPCGLLLTLVATLTPAWRLVRGMSDLPPDAVQQQGIWDICKELEATHNRQCGLDNNDGYFQKQEVQVARGLMVASLAVTALGLVVASLGVRCWLDIPRYALAGAGGLVLFASGVLSLIAVSWYTNVIRALPAPGTNIQEGYSLVLGYLGSCFEIIGGFSLALSFAESCKSYIDAKKYPGPARSSAGQQIGGKRYAGNFDSRWPAGNLDFGNSRDKPYLSDGRLSTVYNSYLPNWQDGSRHANQSGTGTDHGNGRAARSGFSNPVDVTADERPARPRSQLSSLPCDSDLL